MLDPCVGLPPTRLPTGPHFGARAPRPSRAQVLYNLFEWPLQPGARLSVVGISNTHDLDQRVLPRIGSRLTEAKLAFQPYSVAQISGILKGRVAGCAPAARSVLDATALELAARKVASETGARAAGGRAPGPGWRWEKGLWRPRQATSRGDAG
jgi:hypothetical protein